MYDEKQRSQRPPETYASAQQSVSTQKKVRWLTDAILFGYYKSSVELSQFYLE